MTAPSPLAVGLVGCGRWGKLILRDLVSLGAQVHVVARSAGSIANAEAGGATRIYLSAADLPASLDGSVVASDTSTHADVVEALLGSGRPLFVEKPLTEDPARARAIVEAAGERVFVMDKWRYHPGVERIAQVARSGRYGAVRALRSYRLGWLSPHQDADACWHLMPHDLSIVLHVLGELPPLIDAVAVDPTNPLAAVVAWLGDGAGGPRATIEISTQSPEHRRAVIVRLDEATLELADGYDEAVTLIENEAGARRQQLEAKGPMPLLAELETFCNHLRGGPPPMSSAVEALAVVERIAEIRERVVAAPG